MYNVAGSCRDKPPSCMNKPMLIRNTVEKAIEYETRPLLAVSATMTTTSVSAGGEIEPPIRLVLKRNEVSDETAAVDTTIDAVKSTIGSGIKSAQNAIDSMDVTLAGMAAKECAGAAAMFGAATTSDTTMSEDDSYSDDLNDVGFTGSEALATALACGGDYECSELRREE